MTQNMDVYTAGQAWRTMNTLEWPDVQWFNTCKAPSVMAQKAQAPSTDYMDVDSAGNQGKALTCSKKGLHMHVQDVDLWVHCAISPAWADNYSEAHAVNHIHSLSF